VSSLALETAGNPHHHLGELMFRLKTASLAY
jgi:hypothetical protein